MSITITIGETTMSTEIMAIPLIFGSTITLINLINYRKSPDYRENNPLSNLKIGMASLVKGYIYGSFWPFPLIDMLLSLDNDKLFNRHFIPLSVYGTNSNKSSKEEKLD